jgi:hypothetical protein
MEVLAATQSQKTWIGRAKPEMEKKRLEKEHVGISENN